MGRIAKNLWVVALVGCATGTTERTEWPESSQVAQEDTALGPGDIVEVRVYREPDLTGVYRVSASGSFQVPLIGTLMFRGKTAEELAEEIRAKLAAGYLRDPQVTVYVREQQARKIHVLGQVSKPGSFAHESGMTVVQAIASAGGFTKLASKNSVTVTRVVDGKEKTVNLPVADISEGGAPNFELQAGDIVFVHESVL